MGQAVELLQARLKELGFYNGSIISTFDAATKSAVQAFQKKNGIKVTGIADDATQKAIYATSALSVDSTPTPAPTQPAGGRDHHCDEPAGTGRNDR